jgi:FkbM family methyltransferase
MSTVKKHAYRHARRAYHALANREYARDRRALAAVLRLFVRRGDLVFDIGANRGDYTDVLLAIGARVVAVEPNPSLAERVGACYPVVVEQVAVGAARGTLELHLGTNPAHSTLSDTWLTSAPTQDRWSGRAIAVDVVTVADLVARHGEPAFIKIDVEGYEAEVLRGCASVPPTLSFEFQCASLSVTDECLALLGDTYEFNEIASNATQFGDDWCTAARLRDRLERLDRSAYGDVYARLTTSR